MREKYFEAEGVASIGDGDGYAMQLGTHITSGLSSAIGRYLYLRLDRRALAFTLTWVAERYPGVIRAVAGELGDYEYQGPAHYDMGRHERDKRIRGVILAELGDEADQG